MLDEPTNHLDIDSIEVLEDALERFDGTVVAVSHDRYFLDRIADRIVHVADGAVRSYEGGWSANAGRAVGRLGPRLRRRRRLAELLLRERERTSVSESGPRSGSRRSARRSSVKREPLPSLPGTTIIDRLEVPALRGGLGARSAEWSPMRRR